MTDRIKYNETTGKVEVDADVWDMIVTQIPGGSITDLVMIKKLWDADPSGKLIAQHLNIAHNKQYSWRMFTGVKNKFILSEIYPECIISLNPTTQSKHEFLRTALTGISKANLLKIKDHSNQPIQSAVDKLLSGKMNNPRATTVANISKITGVPIHRFIRTTLPTTPPSEMVRIKQMALTEKINILAVALRELKLTCTGLAQTLGVSQSHVSYWKGGTTPRLDAYVALCKYFNVPFDYFSDWLE